VPDERDRELLFDAWLALNSPDTDFCETVRLPMLTGSMMPALPVGSHLVIASPRRTPVGVGSIVVFQRGERLIAHRLLVVLVFGRSALYLEKGDLNREGSWIKREDIRGVVVGQCPPDDALGPVTPVARSRSAALRSALHGIRQTLRRLVRPNPPPAESEGPDV